MAFLGRLGLRPALHDPDVSAAEKQRIAYELIKNSPWYTESIEYSDKLLSDFTEFEKDGGVLPDELKRSEMASREEDHTRCEGGTPTPANYLTPSFTVTSDGPVKTPGYGSRGA